MLADEVPFCLYYNQPLRERDNDKLQELFGLFSSGPQSLRTGTQDISVEYECFFCINFGAPLTAVLLSRLAV
jgi:hypothetical protein